MRDLIRWLLFVSVIWPVAYAHSQSINPSLSAPIFLDQQNLGEVWVYLKPNLALERESFLSAMKNGLLPEAWQELTNSLSETKSVAPAFLEALGYVIQFDEASLTLQLKVPAEKRARKVFHLRGELAERQSTGPDPFSGYLNANGNQGFVYPQTAARQPFRGTLALVSNLKGLVLETGSSYTENLNHEWQREDTRLVKDFEKQLLRASVGDVSILSTGYQNSRTLGGISVTRQYAIQPYANIRPLNRTELWVKRPSYIEVYVNDGFINRVYAPQGPIQLSDFPLFSGINKVDLKITDDTGQVEWINLNLLYDVQLLGAGIQQFAYQVGAPSETFRNDRRYDDKNITFSFFHRLGLSDRFTIGGSFQSDRSVWLGGQDFIWLTRAGLISGESGISHKSGGTTAAAGRLRYKSLDYKLGADKPIRGAAEIEYKARKFASLGQITGSNPYSWRYDLSVSKPITAVTTAGLGFQYSVNREGDNGRAARFDFNSELARQWRTNMSYTWEKENKINHKIQITLTWVQAEGRYYGNLSYAYPTKTTRLEMNRSPSSIVDDFRATLGAQNSPTAYQGDASIEYTHEKGLVRTDHTSSRIREENGYRRTVHSTSLNLSTAVAWVGTNVALTRPIADSFALLTASKSYKSFKIPVNPVSQSAEATINRFGPAVIPTLTSYNETPIILDSSVLPIGYSLNKEYLIARPTYRSGMKIEVGGAATAILAGQFLQPSGSPLALATGSVLNSEGKVQSTFFTNRSGHFLLENLPPGSYSLSVDDAEFLPMKISVSEDATGLVKIPPHKFSKGAP